MPKGINPDTGRSYRFKDRTGDRNGRLVFTRWLGKTRHGHNLWEAVCDCGTVTSTSSPHKTKSCGCLHRETAGKYRSKNRLDPEERKRRVRENRKRQRVRRKSDPVLAMQARLSRLHRHALAQVGALKRSSTFEALGYTPEEFKSHIEKQFSKGMGWDNMNEWQIDHITPVSSAKSEEDVIQLNQLWNLRPLWAEENNKKKNKVERLI